jgi:hypothetical protein
MKSLRALLLAFTIAPVALPHSHHSSHSHSSSHSHGHSHGSSPSHTNSSHSVSRHGPKEGVHFSQNHPCQAGIAIKDKALQPCAPGKPATDR